MEDAYFSSSLGRIYYKHSGYESSESKDTLILLHGFGASSLSWSRFIEKIPDSLNIIAPDLLGHGKSDAPKIDYTINNQAKTVDELISGLKGRRITIMGHSYGGWIAATLAINGRCDNLILEDSAGMDRFDDERLAADPDFREKLIKEALVTNPNEHVLRSIVYSRIENDYLNKDRLSKIKVQTLIIWGEQDMMIPVKFAYSLNSCISGSELYVIKGARHTPHYTNPQEAADKVLSFLAQSKKIL